MNLGTTKRRAIWITVVMTIAVASIATKAHCTTSEEHPVQGMVVTQDGKPIAAVKVHGGLQNWTREQAETDDAGHFRLEHPGAVLHFDKAGFQPQVLVTPKAGQVRVTLGPATDELKFKECGRTPRHVQRIGWLRYGIRFDVDRHKATVKMGKVDADYIVDTVKPKDGAAILELWFGLHAFGTDPMDEDVLRSVKVSQRRAFSGWGMDTRGRTADGLLWRSAGLAGSGGAVYRDASEADAKVLDEVIDSMCWVQYPKKE